MTEQNTSRSNLVLHNSKWWRQCSYVLKKQQLNIQKSGKLLLYKA